MADGTVKISTELDGKGIKTGLSESQKTVRKTFEELAKESGKTVEELKADAKKIAEEYQKQGCDIPNSYKKAYKEMGVSSSKASKEVVDDAEKMADAHEDSSKKSKTAWKKALSAIGGFAKEGLVLAGKVAAGAISAVVGASIKVGAAFESEMSKVQAISGVTGDELAQLTAKAKEMGAKTKFSASESAQAFEYMAMAGWKTDDMLNSIDGVMNLAAASGEDLASVSDIVTDAMTAMGLAADGTTNIVKDGYTKEVSNASHFADVLAAASSNSNTNVAMMGETFKYAAPLAGALGYSVEDLAQAIGLMANSGIKGSEAGTALRSVLTRLAKPPKEAAEAMEQYGISMKNSDGTMKSLMEVMENMRDSLQGLPEDEQAAAAAAIGGQEAMSGLLAIVNASESDFKKLANAIDNADGSAEQMADIMQNNLTGQLTIMRSAAEALGIEIYESIQQPLTDIVKAGTQAINELTEAFKTGGVQGLIAAGTQMVTEFISVIFNRIPEIVTTGIEVVGGFLNGLLSAAPTAIQQASQMLSSWTNNVLSKLPAVISAGGQVILSLLNGLVNNAPKIIQQAAQLVIEFAHTVLQNLPQILQAGIELIGKLLAGILRAVPKIIAAIPGIVSSIGKKFLSYDWLSIGKNIISGIASGVANAAGSLVDAAVNAASSAIGAVKNWLGIHSPSRRARDEIGVQMIAGIGEGVEQETPQLEQASEDSIKSSVKAMKRASASKFVADMQADSFRAAENNEMAAREQARTGGYGPETEDDGEITIVNQFYVDGDKLVEKTVKKTKRQIEKETRAARLAKGDVAFA